MDHGGGSGGAIGWLVAAVALAFVVCTNQFGGESGPPAATIEAPADLDPQAITTKLIVKFSKLGPMSAGDRATLMGQIDQADPSPVGGFRAAVAAGEIVGIEEASSRLDKIKVSELRGHDQKPDATAEANLAEDIETYRAILRGDAVTEDASKGLSARHGYFARLAQSLGGPDSDPERAKLIGGGGRLMAVLLVFGLVIIVAIVGGMTALGIMLWRWSKRRERASFVPPAPGGSVYIESVAVFIAGFALMHALNDLWNVGVNTRLALQWVLLPLTMWPVFRGVPLAEFRRQVGWHAGRGVLREIGAGVAGYFAGLPIFFVAVVMALIVLLVTQLVSGDKSPPRNAVQDLVGKAGTGTLAMLFFLATVWAPIVEETVFRGAFYRHLRGRVGVLLSAIVTAGAFGLMHGYALPLMLPIVALGFVFALVREWRGSLLACIVGHWLHNTTLLSVMFLFFSSLKD